MSGSMASNRDIPIEFPANPDITFAGAPLDFKERGLRGKAGSAPPFDLGRANYSLSPDRLQTLNFRQTGPTPSKKKDQAKVSPYTRRAGLREADR
jgi:E3 SUMO-protein ligase PIAS1